MWSPTSDHRRSWSPASPHQRLRLCFSLPSRRGRWSWFEKALSKDGEINRKNWKSWENTVKIVNFLDFWISLLLFSEVRSLCQMYQMNTWDPDMVLRKGARLWFQSFAVHPTMFACLEASVSNGGTALQYTARKHSSCNAVLLFILFLPLFYSSCHCQHSSRSAPTDLHVPALVHAQI